MNRKVIEMLSEFKKLADARGERFRSRAYENALASVAMVDFPITKTTLERVKKLNGVGKGIYSKIEELVLTGKSKDLEKLKESSSLLQKFTSILGVGPSTASKWINMGIKDIRQLTGAVRGGKIKLTHVQMLGIKYYEDLHMRVPRAEIKAIYIDIRKYIDKTDGNSMSLVAGSYRRKQPTSKDIDILVTNKRQYDRNFLYDFEKKIKMSTKFVDVLTSGVERFSFLYRYSRVIRQVDILYVDYSSFWASVNHFTGSSVFNQRIRALAKSQGYKLNQHGLYKLEKGAELLIPLNSEEELFKILGVDYVPPEFRNATHF